MDSISEDCGDDQAAAGSARSEAAVSVRGLVKRYAGHEAVAGIDLEVRRGEIFAARFLVVLYFVGSWGEAPCRGGGAGVLAR